MFYSWTQSSYLSHISQIIFAEKNYRVVKFWRLLGNFWENLRNFRKFWEILHNLRTFIWRKIEPKKYICGEKMTNMRSAPRVLVGAPWGLVQHFSQDCLGFLSPQVARCVFPCHFLAQKGIKRELFWHHDLYIMGPCVWLECWMIICAGEFAVKALLWGYVYCLNGICLGCASVNIKINIYSTPVQEI